MKLEQLQSALNHLKEVCTSHKSIGIIEDLIILAAIRELSNNLEICCTSLSKEDLKFLLNIALFNHEETIRILDDLSSKKDILNLEQLKLLATFGLTLDALQATSTDLKTLNLVQEQKFLTEYSAVRLRIVIGAGSIKIDFYNLHTPFYKKLEEFFKEELFKGVHNKALVTPLQGKAIIHDPNPFGRWWFSLEKPPESDVKSLIFTQINFPAYHDTVGKTIIPKILTTITSYLYPESTESVELPTIDFATITRDAKYTVFKRSGLTLEQCKEICNIFVNLTSKNALREYGIFVQDNVDAFKYSGEEESTGQNTVPGLFNMFSSGTSNRGFSTLSSGCSSYPTTMMTMRFGGPSS
ncbi:MAG: hypothetical protein ABSA84_03145 [Gammaproteobacteria bacterium]